MGNGAGNRGASNGYTDANFEHFRDPNDQSRYLPGYEPEVMH